MSGLSLIATCTNGARLLNAIVNKIKLSAFLKCVLHSHKTPNKSWLLDQSLPVTIV